MDDAAPPPVVPIRSSGQVQNYYRRRSSLPPPSSYVARRSANNVRLMPASPEVMSSLISSLSTIPSPVSSSIEGLPIGASYSTPTSPSGYRTTFPNIPSGANGRYSKRSSNASGGGFGMDYGAFFYPNNSHDKDLLHPDDAADPPVVRTSRPHSGLSPRNSGPSSSSDISQTLKKIVTGSKSASPQSRRESIESSNTGKLNFGGSTCATSNGGMAENTGTATARKGAERERGLDIHMGMSSLGRGEYMQPRLKSEPYYAGSPSIDEELDVFKSNLEAPSQSASGADSSLVQPGALLDDRNIKAEKLGGGRLVPDRDSSIYKTGKLFGRRRLTFRSSSQPSPSGDEQIGHKDQAQVTSNPYDLNEEDEVARRIKELKEQKLKRDRPSALESNGLPLQRSPLSSPAITSAHAPDIVTISTSQKSFDVAEDANTEEKQAPEGKSAPSPGVPQEKGRQDGLARVSSLTGRPAQSPFATLSKNAKPNSPQRSNSFLRRLSPSSPGTTDPHRRTVSYGLSTTPENTPGSRPSLATNENRPSSADPIGDAVNAYLSSPRLSQKITHPSTGRIISFSEVGDSQGFAVFCCVGMGLTRYITAFYDELARTLNLRLITPERPGIGESEPYSDGNDTPLNWPDDIYAICQALTITKFSLLAHSAGAIYALATALRMPQHIRGRVHLLAPWIPPSQMSSFGSPKGSPPTGTVPTSQRILRALPTPFLRAANSSFMSATSASISSSLPKSPRRNKRTVSSPSCSRETPAPTNIRETLLDLSSNTEVKGSLIKASRDDLKPSTESTSPSIITTSHSTVTENTECKERQTLYDKRLTHAIWDLATTSANPAVDLLVCLERRQTIGFRYVDITRSVVIHHGSRDSRVPVDNVKWLGKIMRRCEVRILEGEGHGLMASATVMGSVLVEMAKEWEDWTRVTQGKGESTKKKADGRVGEK